ncbi:kinase-like domain-containing protein, partial [Cladochytrium replicatum]
MSRTKSSGSKSSKGRPLSASSDDTVIGRESPVHGRKPSWKKTGSSSFGSSKSKKASKDYVLPKVFEEKYILVDQVGFGGHGHVFSARRRTDGFEVAVKFMEKSHIHSSSYIVDSDLGLIPTEAYIVKNVRHPSVIGFVDFFEDSRYVILVQELFGTAWSESPAVDHPESDGPQPGVMGTPARPPPLGSFKPTVHRSMDLFDMLEKNFLTENEIRTVFVQVVEAVHALVRKHNIVHGDIKDENVLVDANLNIKLIDFGGAIK